jgi:CubicO group peptidase (beta-lactamase class C family)
VGRPNFCYRGQPAHARDNGLIGLDDAVAKTVDDPMFANAHNAPITWRHLLQQSSEWQGELFGKSDQVDHTGGAVRTRTTAARRAAHAACARQLLRVQRRARTGK